MNRVPESRTIPTKSFALAILVAQDLVLQSYSTARKLQTRGSLVSRSIAAVPVESACLWRRHHHMGEGENVSIDFSSQLRGSIQVLTSIPSGVLELHSDLDPDQGQRQGRCTLR
jgi:hypothetical protein